VSPALTDVIASVAARLHPGMAEDSLGLPDATRYVVVLIDGLGWSNLKAYPGLAPTLERMEATALTVGVPSTTATSLAALTTGADAAQHGLVGFSFRSRPGVIMQTMKWDDKALVPEAAQPVPTWFERIDCESAVVVPAKFAGSGLTRAVLRGADFVGVTNEKAWDDRVSQAAEVAAGHALTYVYERNLDHVGHLKGWRSPAWQAHLARVDAFVASLASAVPAGTCLLVTADHGMVDTPVTHRVTLEFEPQLAQGVDLVAGEARLRHLYTADPAGVAARWASWWGSRAEVRVRADALTWFGESPPSPDVAARIGDVVVALLDDWAALTTTRPKEMSLVGLHGSITAGERIVPLLKGSP